MILTTAQAAQKLGVSSNVVIKMVDNGLLTSLSVKKDGAKKVFHRFDSTVISEFKKTHKRVGRQWYLNEEAPAAPRPKRVPDVIVTEFSGGGLGTGISTRLENIEEMLRKLLQIWS